MKRLILFILSLSFCFYATGGMMIMAVSEPSPESMLSKGISPISGTFIQPWLYLNYTDSQWEQEIADWKTMGIEYVIMGDTLSIVLDDDGSIRSCEASYPSRMENVTLSTDVITPLLKRCKENGLKVYIGMGNTPAGWPFLDFNDSKNPGIFKTLCTKFAEIAEDLYAIYHEEYADTFIGFYFVPELYNNSAFDSETARAKYVEGMAGGFNIVLDRINALDPSMAFIFSPYVNIFGGSWVSKNYDNIAAFWTELMIAAHFRAGDIFCPQDSVGAGGMDVTKLDDMTKAYKKAVDDSAKGIKLWSNCEIFVQPAGDFLTKNDGVSYWGSATVGRMVEQFRIVSQYAERIFTFAYPHYLSRVNNVSGFYMTYLDYLENGVLETEAPTAPDRFRTSKVKRDGVDSLVVYWSGMYDNFGIQRVNIYKNGVLYTYRYPTRWDGSDAIAYPNNFFDSDYDFQTTDTVTYEFEVIDCAGNISQRTSLVVEPGSVPNNVKLDGTYTGPVSVPPAESSTDLSAQPSGPSSVEPSSVEASAEKPNDSWKTGIIIGGVLLVAGIAIVIVSKLRNKKGNNTK